MPTNPLRSVINGPVSLLRFLGVLCSGIVLLGLFACSSEDGTRKDNLRPFVRLTGGPVEGDSASYTSEFFWTGWDDDGIIDRYQYAIDIPDQFTLEDINNPEDVGIAWKDTTAFRARFLFETPIQDSLIGGGGEVVLPNRYRGNHSIYVRAIDNEGLISEADYLEFTARTLTPKTTITIPRIVATGQAYITVGRQLNVEWSGEDPDNPDPKRRPTYYEWKLIKVRGVLGITDANFVVNEDPGPNFPWNRVGADTTKWQVPLDPPNAYVFAVRAIDEAGGKESKFFFGQNAILMQSSNALFVGRPTLVVNERTLGQNTFPGDGTLVDYEVPQGKCLRFTFSGDAQSYGGTVQAYNWGVDVSDVDAEGPASGFRGWSLINFTYEPICFNTPGVHTVTIKCRDTSGGVTIGTYRLTVLAFPLDRDVLYVDDVYLPIDLAAGKVTDAWIDEKYRSALQLSGFSQVYEFNAWGIGDLDGAITDPRLSDLARYKHLFWSVRGTGGGSQNAKTALLRGAACLTGRILQSYVSAGGSVWIVGETVFGALKATRLDPGADCLANTAYTSESGLNFSARDFVTDYLHVGGGDFRSAKSVSVGNGHGLIRAHPTAKAAGERFPIIEADSTTFAFGSLGGIPFYDAMFQPTFFLDGGLDTLYTAEPLKTQSGFRNKPIAWRYADPNPVPEQGPVGVFSFPMFRMKEGSPWAGPNSTDQAGRNMRGAFSAMEDWFRKNQARASEYLTPR